MRRALLSPSAARLAAPPFMARHQHLYLHTTAPASSAILIGGLSVAGAALAARYALQKLDGGGGGDAAPPPSAGGADNSEGAAADGGANSSSSSASSEGAAPPGGEAKRGGSWFGADALAKRFYRGGFEEKMTRREAALVLGVRESASPERVRERHRKMLMANHPDKVCGRGARAGRGAQPPPPHTPLQQCSLARTHAPPPPLPLYPTGRLHVPRGKS